MTRIARTLARNADEVRILDMADKTADVYLRVLEEYNFDRELVRYYLSRAYGSGWNARAGWEEGR